MLVVSSILGACPAQSFGDRPKHFMVTVDLGVVEHTRADVMQQE